MTQQTTSAGFSIGVDIGGTHTDMIVASASGLTRSKAFTTHDDYSVGVFDAIAVAADTLGITTDELVGGCHAFINSSTIVT
ncbi:MAG: hypothetical protein F2773_05345, partial [Actinobacteria bacterium]|nr:hypothetical protein [Actinomycetota bacterium]